MINLVYNVPQVCKISFNSIISIISYLMTDTSYRKLQVKLMSLIMKKLIRLKVLVDRSMLDKNKITIMVAGTYLYVTVYIGLYIVNGCVGKDRLIDLTRCSDAGIYCTLCHTFPERFL